MTHQSSLSKLESRLKIGDIFQIDDTEGAPYRFLFVNANAQTLFLRHPENGNIYRVHFRHFNLDSIQIVGMRSVLFPKDHVLITSQRGNEHEGIFIEEGAGVITLRLQNNVAGKVDKRSLDPARCYILYETPKPQVFDLIQAVSRSGNRYRGHLLEVTNDAFLIRTGDNRTGKLVFNRLKGQPRVLVPIASPSSPNRWLP